MDHHTDFAQFKQQKEIDFVVPLKQVGLVTRAVLEAIHLYYEPRSIIVVTARAEINILTRFVREWNVGRISYMAEEDFFIPNFNLTLNDLLAEYDYNRSKTGDQREPGWWIQQLIKLGAGTQIPGISPVYVVWDGDLVPLRRWKLCDQDIHGNPRYYVAILQAESRSIFNSTQYELCMNALAGIQNRDPAEGGTFVAHHMVFQTKLVKEMLQLMTSTTGSSLPWPLLIMSYSRKFYRFSEYKTYASFLHAKHPTSLLHHRLADFGEGGLRFRDAALVVNQMVKNISSVSPTVDLSGGLSYNQIQAYMKLNWKAMSLPNIPPHFPGYVQLDHVYGLPNDDHFGSTSLLMENSLHSTTTIPLTVVGPTSTMNNNNQLISNMNNITAANLQLVQQLVHENNNNNNNSGNNNINSSSTTSNFAESTSEKRSRSQSLEDIDVEDSLPVKTPLLRAFF